MQRKRAADFNSQVTGPVTRSKTLCQKTHSSYESVQEVHSSTQKVPDNNSGASRSKKRKIVTSETSSRKESPTRAPREHSKLKGDKQAATVSDKKSVGKFPNRDMEFNLMEKGKKSVCGVDEAGRGPLAGPVVAAAVVLPRDFDSSDIDDSKKLTEEEVGCEVKIWMCR